MKIPHLITMTLWITPLVLQGVIAAVMLWRKLAGVFPLFFGYTALIVAREVALLFIRYSGRPYFLVYWWGEGIAVLLGLGVIVEVIWHLIRPYPFLRKFALRFFWIVAVAALAAGVLMLLLTKNLGQPGPILEAILLLERSARFLQACLLIVLILLMSRLGLTWQYYAIGIALGFGVYSAADLALLEVRANLHLIADGTFALLEPAAYNLAVLIWALYFVPTRPSKVVVERLPDTEIARWNEVLSEYLKK
jgi:hypothetical protein